MEAITQARLNELQASFPFVLSIDDFVRRDIRSRLNKEYDAVVAVTGDEGMGKSHFALQAAMSLDKNFAFDKNILFQPNEKQIVDAIYGLPKKSGVVVDEAIKIMYKRGFQDRVRIMLNTIFATCRKANQAAFLCMPNFLDFDVYYRQHRIWFWVYIIDRGVAVLSVKSNNQFAADKWYIDYNYKVMEEVFKRKHTPQLVEDDYLEAVSKTKNFKGVIFFNALPPDREKEYKALAAVEEERWLAAHNTEQVDDVTASARKVTLAEGRLLGKLLELGLTQKDLLSISGMSAGWVQDRLARVEARPVDRAAAGVLKRGNAVFNPRNFGRPVA